MPDTPITVAIDGPSGSGKSSVSRAVARSLGIAYLDTGATYRALTWACLERDVDLLDRVAVVEMLDGLELEISTDPDVSRVAVDGTEITEAIRATRVSERVSAVATNLDVRARLRELQRDIIARERARSGGVVAEGRDITTVVAPDAEHRILLTASEQARLARRSLELHGTAAAEQLAATRDQVLRRDRDDSTVSNFVEAADGVIALDTSELSFDEVVQAVLALVRGDVEPQQAEPRTPHTPETQETR